MTPTVPGRGFLHSTAFPALTVPGQSWRGVKPSARPGGAKPPRDSRGGGCWDRKGTGCFKIADRRPALLQPCSPHLLSGFPRGLWALAAATAGVQWSPQGGLAHIRCPARALWRFPAPLQGSQPSLDAGAPASPHKPYPSHPCLLCGWNPSTPTAAVGGLRPWRLDRVPSAPVVPVLPSCPPRWKLWGQFSDLEGPWKAGLFALSGDFDLEPLRDVVGLLLPQGPCPRAPHLEYPSLHSNPAPPHLLRYLSLSAHAVRQSLPITSGIALPAPRIAVSRHWADE